MILTREQFFVRFKTTVFQGRRKHLKSGGLGQKRTHNHAHKRSKL